jgi:hypothetical protein
VLILKPIKQISRGLFAACREAEDLLNAAQRNPAFHVAFRLEKAALSLHWFSECLRDL